MAVNDLQLVESCIEEGDLCKLLSLPETLDDFSEASLVKSLEWILKSEEDLIERISNSKELPKSEVLKSIPWIKEDTEAPFSDRKCYVINVMLCQNFSPHFLQEEIRAMSFDCVLNLIKYLHFLLSWSPLEQESHKHVPSLEKIIDWLNALLDGHFQQLKLADDATDIIETLQKQVTLIAKWHLELKTLQGTLTELHRQFEKQQKNTKIGDYCIEVISF